MAPRRKNRPPLSRDIGRPGDDLKLLLAQETDRGCVLVAAGAIDEQLEDLLRAAFEKGCAPEIRTRIADYLLQEGQMPPLGTFMVRANLCYALGLIDDDDHAQLKTLAPIRNSFAHLAGPVEISLQDVNELAPPQKWQSYLQRFHEAAPWAQLLSASDSINFSEARLKFMTIAYVLYLHLIWNAYSVRQETFGVSVWGFKNRRNDPSI